MHGSFKVGLSWNYLNMGIGILMVYIPSPANIVLDKPIPEDVRSQWIEQGMMAVHFAATQTLCICLAELQRAELQSRPLQLATQRREKGGARA